MWPALTWATIPMLLITFFSEKILRYIDPTVEPITIGMLQVVFIAILAVMLANEAAFGAIRFNFKTLFKYYSGSFVHSFSNDFKTITAWQRLLFTVFVFSAYFFAIIYLLSQLLSV